MCIGIGWLRLVFFEGLLFVRRFFKYIFVIFTIILFGSGFVFRSE